MGTSSETLVVRIKRTLSTYRAERSLLMTEYCELLFSCPFFADIKQSQKPRTGVCADHDTQR